MSRRKKNDTNKTQADDNGLDFNVGDIGIETPDFDTALFEILEDEVGEETRYIKPKVYATSADFVMYDNALKLARDIEIQEGSRYDVVVNGSFIFGDFLEAFIVRNNAKCKKLTISTLSLNQNNVDSLHNLITLTIMTEDNGSTGSGNGSTIQSSTAASGRGSSMPFYDPFGGGPSGPAPF